MTRSIQRSLRAVRHHPVVEQIALAAAGRGCLPVYLVGGFLRDALLRHPGALDIDLVCADPPLLGAALAQRFAGTIVHLAERLWRVIFSHRQERGQVDIGPLRGGRILEDLRHRDFTVNALAISLEDDPPRLMDPTGGLRDLKAARIRVTTPEVLTEDPLRLLRSIRLAAQLGFRIEKRSAEAIRRRALLLRRAAPERLREEFFDILNAPDAGRWLAAMDALALLEALVPETRPLRGCLQGPPHRFDVLAHSLETVRALDRILRRLPGLLPQEAASVIARLETEVEGGVTGTALLRFTALVHDVGKPDVRSIEDGRVRFLGHAERGAEIVEEISRRLRLGSRATAMAVTIVREHLRPLHLRHTPRITARARYRFWRDLGPLAADCLLLSLADIRATAAREGRAFREHRCFVQEMFTFHRRRMAAAEARGRRGRLLDGHELMARMRLSPGPFVGFLLARLDEEAGLGALRSKQEALRHLKRHLPALRQEFARASRLDLSRQG